MHLSDLHVEGFRAFQELSVDDLGQVNLVVGTNNTGKTSLLEAIELYSQPFGRPWTRSFRMNPSTTRYSIRHALPSLDRIGWNFHNADIPYALEDDEDFEARAGQLSIMSRRFPRLEARFRYEPSEIERGRLVHSRERQELPEEAAGEMVPIRSLDLTVDLVDPSGREEQTFTCAVHDPRPREPSGRPETIQWQRSPEVFTCRTVTAGAPRRPDNTYWSVLGKKGLEEPVLRLIQELDASIEDLQIYSSEQNVRLLVKQGGHWIPSEYLGQGFRRLLELAGELARAQDGVLLVDEVEAGIHAWLLREFTGWLTRAAQELNVQVFATTHSLEAIDAFLEAEPESTADLVGLKLRRTENGTISSQTIEGKRLRPLREEYGQEVRG